MSASGAPDLLSGPAPAADLQLAKADASDLRLKNARPIWGIFVDSELLIEPDSIVALDYHREWTVADFQMEKGAFNTYDKVAKPFDLRLRMTKGGNELTRGAFIKDIETVGESLVLVDVVTPDRTYLGCTIAGIGYQQTAKNGVGVITFDVALRQVRETASSAMSADVVQDPGSADSENGGTVQPQAPPPAVKVAAQKALARQADLPLLALRGQLQ